MITLTQNFRDSTDVPSNCQDTASVFLASGDPKLLTSVKGCGLRNDILGILIVGTRITAVSIHNPINHTGVNCVARALKLKGKCVCVLLFHFVFQFM